MPLFIQEIFRSLQGEGPAIGAPATFIRLSGCNLRCSFCDTVYEGGLPMSVADIMERVDLDPARVIITGGEPLLAAGGLAPLVRAIAGEGIRVDIETNGTIAPPDGLIRHIDNYVISPKLSNSGHSAAERRLAQGLPAGPLKFAVARKDDLEEADAIAAALPGREVFVMPLGTDPRQMIDTMRELHPAVAARGWRLQPRLHVLLGIR